MYAAGAETGFLMKKRKNKKKKKKCKKKAEGVDEKDESVIYSLSPSQSTTERQHDVWQQREGKKERVRSSSCDESRSTRIERMSRKRQNNPAGDSDVFRSNFFLQ